MSAIERCRTAALGGHVARCENGACGHTVIAYNTCRNRHCPKCQGAAARSGWRIAGPSCCRCRTSTSSTRCRRRSPILPTPTRPSSTTFCSRRRQQATITIAADKKRLGAKVGITSVLHTWGSAMTHHPHVHMIVPGGGLSEDGTKWIACRPEFFLPVRVLSRLFRRLVVEMLAAAYASGKLAFFGAACGLWRHGCVRRLPRTAQDDANGWSTPSSRSPGPRPCSPTCRSTPTASRSRTAASSRRRQHRHVQLQGLSRRRARTLQDHDGGDGRVHPPLPDPRAAEGLPPHPPLRPARQRQSCRQRRQGERVARRSCTRE